MESWLREVDEALDDEEIVDGVMAVMRRRWPQSARRGRAGTPADVVLRDVGAQAPARLEL